MNKAEPEFSFEDALKELETVLAMMESDQLPLHEMMSRYEKGVGLLKRCREELARAQLKVEMIQQNLVEDIKVVEEEKSWFGVEEEKPKIKRKLRKNESKDVGQVEGNDEISLF
jgi:exodeoxyribonuclease VII small subunit